MLVQGDFPKQDIHGLNVKITLDHTTDVPRESLNVKVAHFPVNGNQLSDSPEVKLALDRASGTSDVNAVFVNQELTMGMRNTFDDVKYTLNAKNQIVQEIIDNVLKGIPQVTVNADIKGSLDNLDIHINSNLGDELSKGFQKQLQAKIDSAKGQLKKLIDDKIGANRDKLKAELDKATGGLSKDLDGKKNEADKAVKDSTSQLNAQRGGQQRQLEEEGKKLLKRFNLGG